MMNRRHFLRNGLWVAAPTLFIARRSLSQIGQAVIGKSAIGTASPAAVVLPTVVQSKWSSASTNSANVTLTNVQIGNLIVVGAYEIGNASQVLASGDCTDGVAAYTLDHSSGILNSACVIGSWSRVAAATGSITITVSASATNTAAMNICAYEVSGLASKAYDTAANGTGTSTTPTTGTFTTASAGFIFAMEGETTGGAGITHSAGTNFSISDSGNAHQDDNSGAFTSGCAEHRVTSSSLSNTTASVTIPSQTWDITAFSYK